MLCQNCNKYPASVHFTQIINDHKAEMYLCEQCAANKGNMKIGMSFDLGDIFPGFLGLGGGMPYTAPVRGSTCEKCGMSYEDFKRTGKLGCDKCFDAFRDHLDPILKRIHGSLEHNGKIPSSVSDSIKVSREIVKLKEQLSKAIQSEEYEKAAELRDRIKSLEVSGE